MPLWSPVDERRASIGVFRKVLNMAFRPPDDRSTQRLVEEAQSARPAQRGLLSTLRDRIARPR